MKPRRRGMLGGLSEAALAIALAVALGSAGGCGRSGATQCSACGRPECANLAFVVETRDGRREETCCPRCGLHQLATSGKAAKRMLATDYLTNRRLDAADAVYVEGSDVTPCMEMHAERKEAGCCAFLAWDRCLPSLLAFRSKAAADSFRAVHGGRIRTLVEVDREEARRRSGPGAGSRPEGGDR